MTHGATFCRKNPSLGSDAHLLGCSLQPGVPSSSPSGTSCQSAWAFAHACSLSIGMRAGNHFFQVFSIFVQPVGRHGHGDDKPMQTHSPSDTCFGLRARCLSGTCHSDSGDERIVVDAGSHRDPTGEGSFSLLSSHFP